ncbi:hypothetical protein CK203_111640 [Vitis vinifera]|uniref:Uncharacterized protein n=1 Tax=Vitis vinifera TaxID=29760 RepID=A0A438CQV8_VITVI|nr:hypothetical protein CK203_099435 [Vitis vinifera]RVW25529.1 hypothetical protein CK203_111640 [Vitis vinifera]
MEAINACPHHGFDTWMLVSYFYDGMSSSMKQLLETMCGGDFMSKNPEEAMDFLSYVDEVSSTSPCVFALGGGVSYPSSSEGDVWNHPNFYWEPQPRQYMQPAQAPHQALKLEQAVVNLTKVVEDFVAHQKSIIDQFRQEIDSQDRKMDGRLNDLSQKTDNLKYSSSRLINLNMEREKENFPS